MDDQAGALLQDLMSTDNETREKAERQFDNIQPPQKLLFLLSCYSLPGQTGDQRLLSMILLRRLITSEFGKFYPALPPEHQQQLKEHLLNSIQAEITPQVRNRICECAAELARKLADEELNVPWPELQERLVQWASNPNEAWRHAALHIFADFPHVFGAGNPASLELIKSMLHASLQAQDSMRVRTEAAKAMSSLLKSPIMATPDRQAAFVDLIPLIIKLLADQKNQDVDITVLESVIEISENCPKIMRPHLVELLDVVLAYLQDGNTLESRRVLCLEVVVTLCERAPAMMRRLGQRHIDALLPIILKMMATIEEDPTWDTNDNADQDEFESDTTSTMGESSLDRLAIALGGKQLLPTAMTVLTPMLNSANWMERHAALMAISAMGEGCMKHMMPMLDQIVDGVLNFLGDSHPRVRYAAINGLGQMANDFSPTFEKKFHATVLPRLCEILADNSHPRVQAHAGAALVNFFEECPKRIMVQYLNVIAPPLASILQNKMSELVTRGVKRVLEQVLVTTSALADTCSSDFSPYYDSFVPSIKYIIENANSTELELLRGKAIECISLIGSAVGKERFAPEASGVMDLLLQSQVTNTLSEDSQILSYMIYGWMRLCKLLGKDFEKYLPFVMPSVMKTAALDPQTAVLDEDEVPAETNGEEWTYVPCDDHKSFGIRTVGLEEKATAFEMLLCYAKELKEGFGPYVVDVLKMRLAHFVEFGRKIVCVGRNYAAHAKELNNTVGETPLIFLKPPTAYLMQGNGNIEPPPGCLELHHEVELGVLIERPGKNIPEGEAMQHVGGYTLCLDMTARDVQTKLKSQGAPWELAKAFDTSCPVGDFVPKESIVDPHNLNLWCKVNGIMRQKGNTKDMFFKIPQIVAYVSRYFTLEVGDLILTGTPQGVGPVKSGDTIEAGMNVNNYKMTFIIK